jgi:excisionase family DNA binding protein
VALRSGQRADLERRLAQALAGFSVEVIAILEEIVTAQPLPQEQPRGEPVTGPDDRVWMTSREAAAYAGVGYSSFRKALADGRCRSSQAVPGGNHRIRREWVDEWMVLRGRRPGAGAQ